jgi:hypothetical protein
MPDARIESHCCAERSIAGNRWIAQGKTQVVIDHGGGVFSFKVGSDIVVYISVQTGVRVTIEHIIG